MITAPFLTVADWLDSFKRFPAFQRYMLAAIGLGVCLVLLALICILLIIGPFIFSHLVSHLYGHHLLIH
ncbi:MAG: hypothetical protein BroJett011_18730 [Chloroflexota bacterium]|nr:MAG: hypothetical protein BroJett011_18730 [Chloroflexota bacterium]